MKKFNFKFDLKICTFVTIFCIAIIFIILHAPQNLDAEEILEFNRNLKNYNVKLQVINADGKKITEFMVAVADDDNKRMYGLMKLDKLPQDYGMLFPFDKNEVVVMWMKNTRIALDMLFIDKNNVIVNIKTDATPYSLDLISSEKPVKKVLEINANSVERFGIKVGQMVEIED